MSGPRRDAPVEGDSRGVPTVPDSPKVQFGRRAADRVDINEMLAGGGEMGALVRSKDWSTTSLGPIASWPQALKSVVSTLLNSRNPMFVFWGPELIKIYNDAYRPITGAKHPWALGRSGRDVWPEIWGTIGPMVERVMQHGEASWSTDLMLFMQRSGFSEETYLTFSYSPVRDEVGRISGMLCACSETTEKVLSERRLRMLHDLSVRLPDSRFAEETCAVAADVISTNSADVPFALLYLLDETRPHAQLAAATGLKAGTAATPAHIGLAGGVDEVWPMNQVLRSAAPVLVESLAQKLGLDVMVKGLQVDKALVLPIGAQGGNRARGLLVAGLSPHLALGVGYRDFLDLMTGQVAASMATARTLQRAQERAQALAELDRAKTAFFSNVSHEFRTPLMLMLGPTEELLEGANGALEPAQRESVELIRRNAVRLNKLVNALLDFSRVGSGRVQATFEATDLAEFTRDLTSSFRAAVERAYLTLTVDCPKLDEPIYVDREMWEQIVLNLLSNAFKFTFIGGIEVSLHSVGNDVVLRVKDTGVGVPEEELPRLFERFHRVEGARARTHEGSGIGLALVQELVRLHGGTARVESHVGVGTSFTITLPKGRGHLPPEQIVPAQAMPAASASSKFFLEEALRWLPPLQGKAPRMQNAAPAPRRPHIMLVDDNADMRDYVYRLLIERWDVVAVQNGVEALEAVQERAPDLILTDVMMPELDGAALLKMLRANEATKHIPVVILSARAGEEARLEFLRAGAEDYLIKPFSAKELLARVQTHLELAHLRNELRRQREYLYSLFMQTPAPIAVLRGQELVFEMANERFFEICRRSDVVGKPLAQALPAFRGKGVDTMLLNVMRTGTVFSSEAVPLHLDRQGDGRLEETYWTFSYAPLRSAEGAYDRVMWFANEVTQQVMAAEEREQNIHDLQRALNFSEMFVGVLAHDLRNPLSAISTAAALLEGRATSERIATPVGRILKSADRMDRMIGQLLDFTRIRLGRGLPIELNPVDLGVLARSVVDELEGGYPNSRVELLVEGNVEGVWDSDRLAQMLSNLGGNACRHGQAPIVMRLDGTDSEWVTMEFVNQGTIEKKLLANIFEPLRLGGQKQEGSSGLGLGLFISHEIVTAHRGTIEVMSRDGRTRFTVKLPRRAEL